MYVCRYCGYTSRDSSINYCNNVKCKYYGYSDPQGTRAAQAEVFDFAPPETRLFIPEFLNSQINRDKETERVMRAPDADMRGSDRRDMQNVDKDMCAMPPGAGLMLGLATVPFQQFGKIYPPDKAMMAGTIFPCLNMPYDKNIINRG